MLMNYSIVGTFLWLSELLEGQTKGSLTLH